MRVPLSWLRDFVEVALPIDDLVHRLTMAGLEVGDVEYIGADWQPDKLFVGEVIEVAPHPNADRLVLATVAYGQEHPQTVVTGAPNLRPGDRGQKVAFAVEGAELIDAYSETPGTRVLKRAKIRGLESAGMVCSEKELGLSDDHEGVLILEPGAPVGQTLQDHLGDVVLDIELTPNLARANNIVGMAREVAALTGQSIRQWPPQDAILTGAYAAKTAYTEVSSADPQLCARYSAALIENVTIQPSPAWMQRRLRLAGMRPINNIVDITNYCMLETGQPLHAFDYEKLQLSRGGIVVRQAQPGEHLTTLDDIDRELTPDMLLISDDSGPIALAGVMGGAATEVSDATRHILLESANFDFLSIRRTSQPLRLYSEAGQRFGRGLDAELTPFGLLRAGRLMETLGGGTLHPDIADTYPKPPSTKQLSLLLGDVKRLLGIDIGLDNTVRMLSALEFNCAVRHEGEATTIDVDVPSYRLDVSIPADLIEEIARVHGYDAIPSTLMRDVLPPQRSQPQRQGMEQTRDILVGCGLTEIISYSLTNLDLVNRLHPGGPEANAEDYVRVANPLSTEREFLRRALLPSMVETLQSNARFRQRMMLFEIGRAYLPQPGEELPDEPRRLTIGLTGPMHSASWQNSPGEVAHLGFTHLKGVVETLIARLNAPGLRYESASHPALHSARTAALRLNGASIGIMGELHPQLRESFELPDQPVALLELDLDALLDARQPRHFIPIARFPAVLEDIALVMDAEVPARTVQDTIEAAGGELLRHVELFDLYQGDPIPEGKKSLAYALTFQADDRSLTEDEVRTIYQRIQQRAATELDAHPRQ
ncbi:phenylalanine--tRNA ligase subunit beta [Candidatus Entotheonella serta]|nr:phenylalanine--tRNA ligase subunit beta [Candidatus Entotheonella serta]